jgi:hypothetical protein
VEEQKISWNLVRLQRWDAPPHVVDYFYAVNHINHLQIQIRFVLDGPHGMGTERNEAVNRFKVPMIQFSFRILFYLLQTI